jgi:hypothetical protein
MLTNFGIGTPVLRLPALAALGRSHYIWLYYRLQ